MTRSTATLVGFIAILLWAFLAFLTTASGTVPPFELAAITFAICGSIGLIRWCINPSRVTVLRQPLYIWLWGVGGLFGYHFACFTALRNAPPVEASLIDFL